MQEPAHIDRKRGRSDFLVGDAEQVEALSTVHPLPEVLAVSVQASKTDRYKCLSAPQEAQRALRGFAAQCPAADTPDQ
jgi:hypothetical protein